MEKVWLLQKYRYLGDVQIIPTQNIFKRRESRGEHVEVRELSVWKTLLQELL